MIDIQQEALLTLTEAAGLLPRRRAGAKPHVATLYRWAQRGVRGVTLETIQVGGTKCTSVEALQRFFDRLQAGGGAVTRIAMTRTQARETERRLRAEGL